MIGGALFREIAESTYDWEMWVDECGDLRWVNRAVSRFLPITPEQAVATPGFPLPFVLPEDRSLVREVFERASRGETGNDLEFRIVGADETPAWVSISFQPLVEHEGRRRGFRTSIRDIGLRKSHERLVEESERDAASRAEERTELLASLSHELRTPLHCISGFAELLQGDESSQDRQRYLSLIIDQSSAALRLVEDLLHFASGPLRTPTLRTSTVDIEALVEAQVEGLRARARTSVALRFESDLGEARLRVVDPDRLRQIVANLVTNALRFTDEGSVLVRLARTSEDKRVLLEVIDSGVGMEKDVLERSREAFFQGASTAVSSRGGVGLGLAIVDRLAMALGGELRIESELGRGTRASVSLLLPHAPETKLEVEDAPDEVDLGGLDILVVDDVDPSRELMVAMLATMGLAARSAPSGIAAIEACRGKVPDLVLLDYHMPGLDGVSTAEAIVRDLLPKTRRPMIAILTANVVARSSSTSVDRWLTKPMRRSELLRLLREHAIRASREKEEPARSISAQTSLPSSELDEAVLDELDAALLPSGRSLLAEKGTSLVESLERALLSLAKTGPGEERRFAAHALRGIAAMLGAKSVVRAAAAVEAAPYDEAALLELDALRDATITALRARLSRANASA